MNKEERIQKIKEIRDYKIQINNLEREIYYDFIKMISNNEGKHLLLKESKSIVFNKFDKFAITDSFKVGYGSVKLPIDNFQLTDLNYKNHYLYLGEIGKWSRIILEYKGYGIPIAMGARISSYNSVTYSLIRNYDENTVSNGNFTLGADLLTFLLQDFSDDGEDLLDSIYFFDTKEEALLFLEVSDND